MKTTGIISVMVLASTLVFANRISGKVTAVVDGNTLEVVTETDESYRVVLEGIDCPELGQQFGEEAKQHLEKMIRGREVTVHLLGKDRWGNYVGVAYINQHTDLRIGLLNRGLAWTTEKGQNEELKQLENQAREMRTGLWSNENPTAPWIYRRQQSMLTVKSS